MPTDQGFFALRVLCLLNYLPQCFGRVALISVRAIGPPTRVGHVRWMGYRGADESRSRCAPSSPSEPRNMTNTLLV
jgi:hypothetical protein